MRINEAKSPRGGNRRESGREARTPRRHVGSDHALAATLASEVGVRLLGLRERSFDEGWPRWTLRREADRLAHDYLMAALTDVRPADGVLSEEGVDGPARLGVQRVWIVDPLDGTREFGEPGRTDWAVHVALWEAGDLSAGAVSLPAQGVVYGTEGALPAFGSIPEHPRVLVSRSRPHPLALRIATALEGELVPMGSAGAKAMAVVDGRAEVYAHAGGQYEWDSAAPVAVARAAGLHASRLDGAPLRYNRADPWLPDLLICREELTAAALEAVAGALKGGAA